MIPDREREEWSTKEGCCWIEAAPLARLNELLLLLLAELTVDDFKISKTGSEGIDLLCLMLLLLLLRGQRGKLKSSFLETLVGSTDLDSFTQITHLDSESQFSTTFHTLEWVYYQSSERINVRTIYHKVAQSLFFDANSSSHPSLSFSVCSVKERELRILFLGLDNAGKTTILKRINGEPIDTISPTLGFNIKTLLHNG